MVLHECLRVKNLKNVVAIEPGGSSGQQATRPALIFGFRSKEQLLVFLIPLGLNDIPSHGSPRH